MKELHGPVENFTWEEQLDFSDEKLGTGWVFRQHTIHNTIKINKNFETGKRSIIIPSNEEFLLKYLVEKIKNAKDFICVSSFLIQKSDFTTALLESASKGIKVFILTARESDLSKAKDDLTDSEIEKINEHKELLDHFAGNILVRTSDSFHAKYCLVDPVSPEAFGIFMTCNATVEAMRGANQEIALSLTNAEIRSFFSHFLRGFWEMANYEILTRGDLTPVKRDHSITVDYGKIDLPVTTQNLHSLREKILDLIKKAQRSLIIGTWSFDEDTAINKNLIEALERGIEIKIFTRPSKRNTASLKNLVDEGVQVLGQNRFHAKFLIADNSSGIVTTSNFTKLGLDTGFEVAVVLDSSEIEKLAPLIAYWEGICDWELKVNIQLKEADEKFLLFSPGEPMLKELKIEPELQFTNPRKEIESCEQVLNYSLNQEKAKELALGSPDKRVKVVKISETLELPILPLNASKSERKDVPFPYYSLKNKRFYIVVETWEDVLSLKDKIKKMGKTKIVIKKR